MFNFKNPQTIHIVSEVVVLIALVIWVSSYKKKINCQIDKLHLRLEEQEEKIQKLEAINNQLQQNLQQQRNMLLQHQTFLTNLIQSNPSIAADEEVQHREHQASKSKKIKEQKVQKVVKIEPEKVKKSNKIQPITPIESVKSTVVPTENPKVVSDEADSEAESITDLDEELADELKDLEVDDTAIEEIDTEHKLKKKTQK